MNNTFAKYIDNDSILTKLDSRVKIFITLSLLIVSFFNIDIISYSVLFSFILIIMLIGKIRLNSIFNIIKNTWFITLLLLLINVFLLKGEHMYEYGWISINIDGIFDTLFIFLRIVIIILISNILTSSTKPKDLTKGIEFYLTPLKIFKIDISEVALMITIAIRFIPTLMSEASRIKDAQVSRGAYFDKGNPIKKTKASLSLITPLFASCFSRSEQLSEAMVIKGYGMGKRSCYKKLKFTYRDLISVIVVSLVITGIFLLNGVIV